MEPAGSTSKRLFKVASKRSRAFPRRAQDLSKEELLLTLQKKRECNATALKIVEGMLEPNVQEDWFLDVLKDINQSHFQDIIEERAIIKLCGYPLCCHELKHVPAQQFRISTKLNKVYDIQERKNFCSNRCFKSCKYVKDQMLTSPLWLRDIEPIVKFTLLPSTDPRGGVGDEVNVQVERVSREEVQELSKDDTISLKTKETSTDEQKALADLLDNLKVVESLWNPYPTDTVSGESTQKATEPLDLTINRIVSEELTAVSCIKPKEQSKEGQDIALCDSSVVCDSPELSCNKLAKESITSAVELPLFEAHKLICSSELFSVSSDDTILDSKEDEKDARKLQEQTRKDCEVFSLEKIDECKQIGTPQFSSISPVMLVEQVKTVTKTLIKEFSKEERQSRPSNVTCGEKSLGLSCTTEKYCVDNEALKAHSSVSFSDETSKSNFVSKESQNSNCTVRTPDGVKLKKEEIENCSYHSSNLNPLEDCSNVFNDASIGCMKSSGNNKIKGSKRLRKMQHNSSSQLPGPVALVEKCLRDWFTMETMCYLFGEQVLKEMLENKGEKIQAHYKALSTITWDQEKHERFLTICKRLSLLEMEDSSFDNQVMKDSAETKLKPLPDYNALKKESETMDLKVKAFYKGKMETTAKKVSFAEDAKSESIDCSSDIEPQLPLVHLHSQRALRKRIVLEGLNRVLPDFLRTFGMRPSELSSSVRGLIGTFALSPTNIMFKPQEWNLLGLVVIKLLSLREPELKQRLHLEKSNTYLTLMLMSYGQEPGYLDQLLAWLTDIDKLLEKSPPSEI